MWAFILKFINWLFGKRADKATPPPPPPKTEPPPPQKIDWAQTPPLYRKRKSLLTFHECEFYIIQKR